MRAIAAPRMTTADIAAPAARDAFARTVARFEYGNGAEAVLGPVAFIGRVDPGSTLDS